MATFLGKFAFGSTDTNQAQKFLTAFRLQRDWYAGMAGSAASDPAAACNLYDAGTGIIVQLVTPKGLRYLTVGSVGWIEFTDDLSQAAMFQGPGQLATWTST